MSERETKSELWRYRVHKVEHISLALLVLELNVAVIEVLLKTPLSLSHSKVRRVHHEDATEKSIERQRVLTLHHKLALAVLTHGHEACALLVTHGASTTSNKLERSFKLALLGVGELPLQAGHEVLAEGQRQFKDGSIVLSMGLACHSSALQDALEGGWVALGDGTRLGQQSLHFLRVARHLTVVGLEDALELGGCLIS